MVLAVAASDAPVPPLDTEIGSEIDAADAAASDAEVAAFDALVEALLADDAAFDALVEALLSEVEAFDALVAALLADVDAALALDALAVADDAADVADAAAAVADVVAAAASTSKSHFAESVFVVNGCEPLEVCDVLQKNMLAVEVSLTISRAL